MFESQGLSVDRLQRVQIGRIKLGELPAGKWRVLRESEVATLLRLPSATSTRESRPVRPAQRAAGRSRADVAPDRAGED